VKSCLLVELWLRTVKRWDETTRSRTTWRLF
jgi:hypothetical protein